MLLPRNQLNPDPIAVASHYDELDLFYRDVWGHHVHHGLWTRGNESVEEATLALTRSLIERAGIASGQRVCDVGCGYGETSRILAADCGAQVTGYTVSPVQCEFARQAAVKDTGNTADKTANPRYVLEDWLKNQEQDGSFDVVLAIESSEHMPDIGGFFRESFRVLKPGGRLVVCAWLGREHSKEWEDRWLLSPICEEGRLRLCTRGEYENYIRENGLVLDSYEDVTARVKKTWTICLQRVLARLVTRPSYRSFLLKSPSRNKDFLKTLLRMRLAYETGSLAYGIFCATKPLLRARPA